MFHRQSVCGLILGLALVLLAGVFRPAEGTPPLKDSTTNGVSAEPSGESPGIDSARSASEHEDGDAPGQITGRPSAEAPGKLP